MPFRRTTKRIFLQTKVCQEISVFSCKENVPGVMGIRDDFLVYFFANVGEHLLKRGAEAT